jgi:hypothetical protein
MAPRERIKGKSEKVKRQKAKFEIGVARVGQSTIAWLFIVVLTAGLAGGKYSGGTGEPNDPYRIATPNDLNDIANQPEDFNRCFILVNDINMAGFSYTTALIAPDTNSTLGFQGTPFTGVFEGNDRSISKLNINAVGAGNRYLGLFGKIGEAGEAKNFGIEEVIIFGGNLSYLLGSLCGVNHGTVNNCYASGFVDGRVGSRWYLGGLCGSNHGRVSHCYVTVSVLSVEHCESVGGLCGENTGTIINCYSSGSVTGGDYSENLGGLCGENHYGAISNCHSSSPVTGGNHCWKLGGLCGFSHAYNGTSGRITDCYSRGSVTGGDYCAYVGGLCGTNAYCVVSNCYSIGSVSTGAGSGGQGGLCGSDNGGTITGSYFLEGAGPDNGIGTPLTDTQMKEQATFTNWDFIEIWNIGENQTYPFLRVHPAGDLNHDGLVDWRDVAILASRWLEGIE